MLLIPKLVTPMESGAKRGATVSVSVQTKSECSKVERGAAALGSPSTLTSCHASLLRMPLRGWIDHAAELLEPTQSKTCPRQEVSHGQMAWKPVMHQVVKRQRGHSLLTPACYPSRSFATANAGVLGLIWREKLPNLHALLPGAPQRPC